MLAHEYAHHIPAHIRVGRFIADEPRLAWAFPFLHALPKADVLIHGGTTRDAILGRVTKDVHVIVHGVPEEHLPLWKTKLHIPSSLDIRLPKNGDAQHHSLPLNIDLAQRDATVNALAYSLRDGTLLDPFNGLKDLEEQKLRTVLDPEKSFHHDPLRMLRFLRLAAELGFTIEEKSWEALKRAGHKIHRLVTDVNGKARFALPRTHLGREFLRALEADANTALTLFHESGFLQHLAPELLELEKLEEMRGRRALEHAEQALSILKQEHMGVTVLFATLLALLEDGSASALRKLEDRLHLPKMSAEFFSLEDVHWLLAHQHVLEDIDPDELSPAAFEHLFHGERGKNLLALLHALSLTSHHFSETRERVHRARRRKAEMETEEHPKLLRGRDLLSLGLQPGPHLRLVMEKVRDAQLQGKIHSKTDALDFARHFVHTSQLTEAIR